MADREEKAVEKVTKEGSRGDGDDNVPITAIDTLMADREEKAVEKVNKEGLDGNFDDNVSVSAIDRGKKKAEDSKDGGNVPISANDRGKKKLEDRKDGNNVPISAIDRGKKKEDSDNVPISAIDRIKKKVEESDAEEVLLVGNAMPSQVKKEESSKENSATTIDSLPDDVLHRLFSLVPARVLAQASILSKRWSIIWKTIPYLEFHYAEFGGTEESYEQMMNCVNCILLMRTDCAVHTFRYPAVYRSNPLRFFTQSSGWILYCLKHSVRVLAVCISTRYSPGIVELIFSNNNLMELKVEFYKHGPAMEHLSLKKLYLPKLKFLYLLKVHLDDTSVSLIINGCPILTKFILESCNLDITAIKSNTLEYFSIKGKSLEPDKVLKSLHAPKMSELLICEEGYAMRGLRIEEEDMPLLQTASIELRNDMYSAHNPREIISGRGRIFDAFTSVQTLELTGPVIPDLIKRELRVCLVNLTLLPKRMRVARDLLILHNVKNLHLGGFCLICNFEVMLHMLSRCPNMVELILAPDMNWCLHQDEEEGNALRGPICSFQKLASIEIQFTEWESTSILVDALKRHGLNDSLNVEIKWSWIEENAQGRQ